MTMSQDGCVPIPAKDLSVDQLIDIFHLFCKAYHIDIEQRGDIDEMYFRYTGIQAIKSGSWIDYRPFMGGKFFANGYREYIQFSGYTSDSPQDKESKEFNTLVRKYLNEKSE